MSKKTVVEFKQSYVPFAPVQEATVSRYLKALKEGLEESGRVMLDLMPTLFGVDRKVD